MKFLLVEDSPNIRSMVRRWVMQQFSPIEAIYECSDGLSAVDLYRKFQPDWVLMDIKLPEMDGLKATKQITETHPAARVIILTQYNDAVYRDAATSAGAYGYVLKEHLEHLNTLIK